MPLLISWLLSARVKAICTAGRSGSRQMWQQAWCQALAAVEDGVYSHSVARCGNKRLQGLLFCHGTRSWLLSA
jgi:hypothetical protein